MSQPEYPLRSEQLGEPSTFIRQRVQPSTSRPSMRGMCKKCAPDSAVEISGQQSAKAVEKIHKDVTADGEDSKMIGGVGDKKVAASRPTCHVLLASNAKFCPECRMKVS